jgi:hypothetical protein
MAAASEPVRFSVSCGLAGRLVRSLRLAAVAWVAMVTVLVCAVVPAGLPLTTAQGSAFNPATTAVALQARAPHARLLVKRLIEPGADVPTAVVHSSAFLPVPASVAGLPTRTGYAWVAIELDPLGTAALEALPWARGPPAA